MAEIQGLFSTANILAARRKLSTSDKLWLAFADSAKLALFARTISSKNVTDPKFRWFEQSLPQSYVQVNNATGYAAGNTSIVVDDASPVRAGTVLKAIATGEQLRVTAVNTTTNTITVQRGWGTTAAASIADNAILSIIGDANAEGASLPEAITREPVEKYNYTQVFREPIKLTETEAATDLYPDGGDMKTKRMIAAEVHKMKIEKAFLFGEPKEDTSTAPTPIRATGGLNYFITTNVTNAGGALTQAEFESFVESGFVRGERKLGILSPLVASAVSYWAGNKLVMYPKDKTFGIEIKEYVSPHGSLEFVVEKMLRENATWNGYAYIVDLDKVGYRYLSGNGVNRDTRLRPNRQAAGDDLIAEEYLTECGLFLADEESHARLYGVTSYS
jgi:hypothetical protein